MDYQHLKGTDKKGYKLYDTRLVLLAFSPKKSIIYIKSKDKNTTHEFSCRVGR